MITMPQYKVPQNLDMQDRIVGPLTMYQFLYLVIGFMVVYAIFRSGSILLFILVGLPIALLALALAFIKINDQPFLKFLLSLLGFLIKPKISIWHHGQGVARVEFNAQNPTENKKVSRKPLDREQLANIAARIDQGG